MREIRTYGLMRGCWAVRHDGGLGSTQPPDGLCNHGAAARGSFATLCLGINDELDAKNTTWDSDFVTHVTQKLIEEFEALPDRDRSELVAELARRVALAPHDLPQDEDLLAAADRLFADLDRRERPE
jgi:hypothetical protein